MAASKVLLISSLLVAMVHARPQLSPASVYSYRFEGPEQTKEESRDALGNVRGSYSINYPDGGGTLTYRYAHPARLPVFRTTAEGPLGPAGTLISFQNSKDSSFLIEMLEQRLDNREPPVVTKTEAVLIEAAKIPDELQSEAPFGVSFSRGPQSGATRDGQQQQAVAFMNIKESQELKEQRKQSLLEEPLGGRSPPQEGPDSFIVEAAGSN